MPTTATDLRYGRRGGRFAPGARPRVSGPPCQVCDQPMVVGQRIRHSVCSPPCPTCGYPTDLIPDIAKHSQKCANARTAPEAP